MRAFGARIGRQSCAGKRSCTVGSVVVGPGQSIQAAVNHAKPGSTIIVRGIHRETVVVHKDGIRLVGKHAVIKPPRKPSKLCPPSGFCVIGSGNFNTGKVSRYVKNVTISGFTIRNFDEYGIFALGARNATFVRNRAFNNDEYGIVAFTSIGTRMISNTTSGSTDEAGLYVGDSPHANATAVGNNSYGNEFGLLVRNATHGRIAGHNFHNNCLGTVLSPTRPDRREHLRWSGTRCRTIRRPARHTRRYRTSPGSVLRSSGA